MKQYMEAVRRFCRDPITGEYDLLGGIMVAILVVTAPLFAPLYYLGCFVGYFSEPDAKP